MKDKRKRIKRTRRKKENFQRYHRKNFKNTKEGIRKMLSLRIKKVSKGGIENTNIMFKI